MSDMGVGSAWHSEHQMHLNQRERAEKAEAERDEVRELLREANNWIGRDCTNVREQIAELTPLCNRIDAALKEAK